MYVESIGLKSTSLLTIEVIEDVKEQYNSTHPEKIILAD